MHSNSDASAGSPSGLFAEAIITQPSAQRLPSEFLQILVVLDRQKREKRPNTGKIVRSAMPFPAGCRVSAM